MKKENKKEKEFVMTAEFNIKLKKEKDIMELVALLSKWEKELKKEKKT